MEIQQRYVTTLFAVIVALLCVWIGVTGRLGSILGAFITPGFMSQGMVSGNGSSTDFGGTPLATSDPTATTVTPGSQSPISMLSIAALAWNAGILTQNALALAVAVAQAESGGRTGAHNPGNGTTDIEDSYGLWQINRLAHPSYTAAQLYTGSGNAMAMVAISNAGRNWSAWGTYTSGAYKAFMSQASIAAAQAIKANS